MMQTAIFDAVVFDGLHYLHNHAVLLDDDRVVRVCPDTRLPSKLDRTIRLNGRLLAPGFVDLQVNGGGGEMFSSNPTISTLRTISEAHRRFGTTAFFPTVITTNAETMRASVDAVRAAMGEGVPGILGIHFEGPHLSVAKAGAHNTNHMRDLDDKGMQIIESLEIGTTIVTLAPECVLPEQISRLASIGIVVCAGHSDADYETTERAVSSGVAGFTHLFNAMSQMTARAPGMVGAALSSGNTWISLIADGVHIHPAVFASAVRAKQPGGAVLVTDAMPPVGTAQESFNMDGERIRVADGQCLNADGVLAGSVVTMNEAVGNASKFAKIEMAEAFRMASLYPARATGLGNCLGRIRPGYVANLVDIDQDLEVHGTWCAGRYEPVSTNAEIH